MKARERLVIVGGGMAAGRLLERLIEHRYRGAVTVVSEEPCIGYNRVLLPALLAGACDEDMLRPRSSRAPDGRDLVLMRGRRGADLDTARRCLELDSGEQVFFDRLVLATGARVPLPDIPGIRLPGVTVLRSLADVAVIRRLAGARPPAVVIGGGLLGLEAAQSLLDLGLQVRVVHRQPRLLSRQLDGTGSDMLRCALERRGLEFRLSARPAALVGGARLSAVRLDSGETLPASLVVFATGTRPNDDLAARSGIRCDGGVLVDSSLVSSDPRVYALGECARVAGVRYALVDPVFRQADALAQRLTGVAARFVPPAAATRLKTPGLEVFSCGDVAEQDDEIRISDPRRGLYRRLCFRGGRLVGAVLFGDAAGSARLHALIDDDQGSMDADQRARLAFGLDAAAAA